MENRFKFRVWDGSEMIDPIIKIKDSIRESILAVYHSENGFNSEDEAFELGDGLREDIDTIFNDTYEVYKYVPSKYSGEKARKEWVTYKCLASKLMQCTGLKDKNGKLIYEGDYVTNKEYIFVVEWDKASLQYKFESLDKDDEKSFSYYYIDENSCLEIIGNIYENPELLTNKGN